MGSLGTTPELLLLVRRPDTHRRPSQGPFSTRGASTLPTLLQSGRQVSVVSWSGPGDQTGLPAPRSPSRSPALDPRLQVQFPELTRPPCRPPRSCIQGSLSAMAALLPLSRHFPSWAQCKFIGSHSKPPLEKAFSDCWSSPEAGSGALCHLPLASLLTCPWPLAAWDRPMSS